MKHAVNLVNKSILNKLIKKNIIRKDDFKKQESFLKEKRQNKSVDWIKSIEIDEQKKELLKSWNNSTGSKRNSFSSVHLILEFKKLSDSALEAYPLLGISLSIIIDNSKIIFIFL